MHLVDDEVLVVLFNKGQVNVWCKRSWHQPQRSTVSVEDAKILKFLEQDLELGFWRYLDCFITSAVSASWVYRNWKESMFHRSRGSLSLPSGLFCYQGDLWASRIYAFPLLVYNLSEFSLRKLHIATCVVQLNEFWTDKRKSWSVGLSFVNHLWSSLLVRIHYTLSCIAAHWAKEI